MRHIWPGVIFAVAVGACSVRGARPVPGGAKGIRLSGSFTLPFGLLMISVSAVGADGWLNGAAVISRPRAVTVGPIGCDWCCLCDARYHAGCEGWGSVAL